MLDTTEKVVRLAWDVLLMMYIIKQHLLVCECRKQLETARARVGSGCLKIEPALFPGRRSFKATKPGSSSCVFILCINILYFIWMFAFVMLGLVPSVVATRLVGKNVSEMTYFVLSGMENLNSKSRVKEMHVLVATNSDSPPVLMQLHQTMNFDSGVDLSPETAMYPGFQPSFTLLLPSLTIAHFSPSWFPHPFHSSLICPFYLFPLPF